jgi:hypothetical protein
MDDSDLAISSVHSALRMQPVTKDEHNWSSDAEYISALLSGALRVEEK